MNNIPKHIAIVMDGNRRWAKKHGLSAIEGHRKVADEVIANLIEHAVLLKIPYLTLWAWSSENWNRPKIEVNGTIRLFRWALKNKAQEFIDRGARLNLIGDLDKFPSDIKQGLQEMVDKSRHNTKITVTYALNYGGRDEIIRAVRKLTSNNQQTTNNISEDLISQNLDTRNMPDPDLIIRPGGQKRLSGYLTWQSVYSELYFTDTLMPDFGPDQLDIAIADFQQRKRTFGGGAYEEVK